MAWCYLCRPITVEIEQESCDKSVDDPTWPLEVHSLGRTLKNWRDEIIAWLKI